MNKIDWQAYLDGSLSPAEMQAAKEILASDPHANGEFEGLKALREEIKRQAHGEHVPLESLNSSLKQIVRENKTPWFAKSAVLVPTAIAACALVAFAVFSPTSQVNPINPPKVAQAQTVDLQLSPFQAEIEEHDPVKAAKWLAEKLDRPAPVLTLANAQGSELDGVECGYCWIAYKVSYKGEHYTLYGRKESDRFDKMPPTECGDKTLYELSDGIAWRCKGDMSYVLKGGNAKDRRTLAETAIQETPNLIAAL